MAKLFASEVATRTTINSGFSCRSRLASGLWPGASWPSEARSSTGPAPDPVPGVGGRETRAPRCALAGAACEQEPPPHHISIDKNQPRCFRLGELQHFKLR